VAEKLGMCRSTDNWKNQLLGRAAPASMKRHNNLQLQLQLERDLLRKANEIKKSLGVDLQLLTNRKKTSLVDAFKELYALPKLLVQLALARS